MHKENAVLIVPVCIEYKFKCHASLIIDVALLLCVLYVQNMSYLKHKLGCHAFQFQLLMWHSQFEAYAYRKYRINCTCLHRTQVEMSRVFNY